MCWKRSCVPRLKFCERGVVFQDAGHHFEIGDASGEGVGEGFEDEDRERLRVVDFALDGITLVVRAP